LMNENNFEIIWTEDGSPSLRDLHVPTKEAMHHSGGAWSESLYIYAEALSLFQSKFQRSIKEPFCVASIGLGLGYNELMTLSALNGSDFGQILSFEKNELLEESLLSWLAERPSPFSELYDHVFNLCQHRWKGTPSKARMLSFINEKRWFFAGPLESPWGGIKAPKSHLIYYDAFSKKSNDALWDYNFLESFLRERADRPCVFASYACTGALNKVLDQLQFTRLEKPGFHGKRNSTLAWRDLI